MLTCDTKGFTRWKTMSGLPDFCVDLLLSGCKIWSVPPTCILIPDFGKRSQVLEYTSCKNFHSSSTRGPRHILKDLYVLRKLERLQQCSAQPPEYRRPKNVALSGKDCGVKYQHNRDCGFLCLCRAFSTWLGQSTPYT